MSRKIFWAVLSLLWGVSVIPGEALSLDYPTREIVYYCPFGPGSNSDNFARLASKYAEKYIPKHIAVEDKVGGGGALCYAAIAAAKPDGYTIGGIGTSTIAQPYMFKGMTFNWRTSYSMICQMDYSAEGLFVVKGGPFDIQLKELTKRAKEKPDTIKCGIGGTWTPQDVARELFEEVAGVKFIKVPFPSANDAIPALLGGHLDIVIGPASEWAHLYRGGRINVLGISNEERDARFPQIPTFKEMGYTVVFDVTHWIGAPKGVPDPIIRYLAEGFKKAFTDPGFVKAADDLGSTAAWLGPEDTVKAMDARDQIIQRIFKKYGVKPK